MVEQNTTSSNNTARCGLWVLVDALKDCSVLIFVLCHEVATVLGVQEGGHWVLAGSISTIPLAVVQQTEHGTFCSWTDERGPPPAPDAYTAP